ncbi:hypothetical protein PoB_001082400 [Plakobranchus ocellatus]|uniref:PHD-type domain-containing protein n=1 Tax=Plakobranchus ocellatus TaxID=259542 RepID=A0AAV3YQF7_9GAST|nr:hypothetical protein PoB_001082400 [Plakobranchus ocellatus]
MRAFECEDDDPNRSHVPEGVAFECEDDDFNWSHVPEGMAFECEDDDPNLSHIENNHNMACGDSEGDMANNESERRMVPCDDVVNAENKVIHEEADFDQLDLHIMSDHNYSSTVEVDEGAKILTSLTFKKCIKKRGRPKGAGKTSGHYCKKRKVFKNDTESSQRAHVEKEGDGVPMPMHWFCEFCRKIEVQGEKDPWTQWIECNVCLKWFHKTCIFGECKKVPKSFTCTLFFVN